MEVTPPPSRPFADEPLIGVSELAEWLGVSHHTVKKWIQRGPQADLTPRALRVNGQVRFRPEDVREWLESKEIK